MTIIAHISRDKLVEINVSFLTQTVSFLEIIFSIERSLFGEIEVLPLHIDLCQVQKRLKLADNSSITKTSGIWNESEVRTPFINQVFSAKFIKNGLEIRKRSSGLVSSPVDTSIYLEDR